MGHLRDGRGIAGKGSSGLINFYSEEAGKQVSLPIWQCKPDVLLTEQEKAQYEEWKPTEHEAVVATEGYLAWKEQDPEGYEQWLHYYPEREF